MPKMEFMMAANCAPKTGVNGHATKILKYRKSYTNQQICYEK